MNCNFQITRVLCVLLSTLIIAACNKTEKATHLFSEVSPSHSKIDFENSLEETDEFNIIEYLYFYNGGGVAAGDINNDGLPDLYFSSNQKANKLYLNKGNFVFDDITDKAGVEGKGNWKTGVTMADVNGDGFLDIFICGVGDYKSFNGENQLLINNGDLTFTDRTQEYGLAFRGFSTQASFLDYDGDGDLDMYLLNHSVHSVRTYGDVSLREQIDPHAGDKLYRNDLIPFGAKKFTDVTLAAGITSSALGYGLGIGVSDINLDGNPDIYVSNDFHENDYLYINDGKGKFEDVVEKSIPHCSRFSMGNDIADINNDGWPDIITLDMLPKNEKVIKTTAGEDPFDIYQFKLKFGYHTQFARNTLQLNRGLDSEGNVLFSDVAAVAGIEATDWSWAALAADFDNDGNKDIFIANGILRRPNDMDYVSFIAKDSVQKYSSDREIAEKMPSGMVPDFFFRNKGDLTFEDVSSMWLGNEPDLSNGAAYADLDNDGDLDLVVNHLNGKPSVYRNGSDRTESHYLDVQLQGKSPNNFGVGAKVIAYADEKKLYHEVAPSRGWLSSVDYKIHIGLGPSAVIDSLIVIWPDKKYQTLKSIVVDTLLNVKQTDAGGDFDYRQLHATPQMLGATNKLLRYRHIENDFKPLNEEKLIPHVLSTEGPAIACADVNGDKLTDLFIGGAAGQLSQLFIQRTSGELTLTTQRDIALDVDAEDIASAFFDADEDGDADLLVAGGGQQFTGQDPRLLPRLYLNNGRGVFSRSQKHLPRIFVDASCVRPGDFDNDGDLDIFIGARVLAGQYGVNPTSYLLQNNGRGEFRDITSDAFATVGEQPGAIGMVTDAFWTDLNSDNRSDLVVAGEWMPLTIFEQQNGKFIDKTKQYGLGNSNGWWNALCPADLDGDGDLDFLAGNFGWNSKLRPSLKEPVSMIVNDIDHNGSLDHLLTYFNDGKEHPTISKDQLVKQVPSLKKKFLKYRDYGNVKLEDIVPIDKGGIDVKRAYTFSSAWIENMQGKFILHELPVEAQAFPIFSLHADDIDEDGDLDVLAVGNLYGVQPDFGRYDAGYGLMLLNGGQGSLKALPLSSSGFLVKGEARGVESVLAAGKKKRWIVTRNNDTALVFERKQKQ